MGGARGEAGAGAVGARGGFGGGRGVAVPRGARGVAVDAGAARGLADRRSRSVAFYVENQRGREGGGRAAAKFGGGVREQGGGRRGRVRGGRAAGAGGEKIAQRCAAKRALRAQAPRRDGRGAVEGARAGARGEASAPRRAKGERGRPRSRKTGVDARALESDRLSVLSQAPPQNVPRAQSPRQAARRALSAVATPAPRGAASRVKSASRTPRSRRKASRRRSGAAVRLPRPRRRPPAPPPRRHAPPAPRRRFHPPELLGLAPLRPHTQTRPRGDARHGRRPVSPRL
mmetsp:Transcript_25633/g.78858  ORF Transcript_25633/g.78858 Transcript_25633/m.78858 type:complete len:287 (-) Transcript_25633:466-1326(-)